MLSQIPIRNFRNVSDLTFRPSDGTNIIIGSNGSGKTSLLEAIHVLALGKSFRSRSLKTAIQFEQAQFQVIAKTTNNTPVGLQFSLEQGLSIRLNSMPLKRLSELAAQLPLQFIPANCHHFFEQGPKYRRQLLDWGLFHVEPNFNFYWQSYKKIIQQRNSALRQRKKLDEIQLWDAHLVSHGEQITELRRKQLDRLLEQFSKIFPRLCPAYEGASFEIKYKNGWSQGETLASSLAKSIERDQQLTYTRSGSHAADWSFKINGFNPAEIFSRGQQKLLFLALCMSQAKITEQVKHEKSILLFDDLSSELDMQHQQTVMNELRLLPVQSFITATKIDQICAENDTVFHVESGNIRQ